MSDITKPTKLVSAAADGEALTNVKTVETTGSSFGSIRSRIFDIKTLLGFGISAAIVVFFLATVKIDVGATINYIGKANWLYLLLALGVYYAAFYVRGLRWQLLLSKAGFEQEPNVKPMKLFGLIEITYLAWFVNCLVPAKLGDAYRAYLLKKNTGASVSRTFGTVFGERLAEILVLFVLLLVSGLAVFGQLQSGSGSFYLILGLGSALVAAVVGGLLALRYLGDFIEKFVPVRFRNLYHRFRNGTLNTFRRDIQFKLYLFTLIVWGCEALRLFLVLQSFGITSLALPVIIFSALASSLLSTIPFTPAGLGAVEGTLVVILTLFGLDKNLAGAVVVLDRVISYWSNIVFGGVLFAVSKKK